MTSAEHGRLLAAVYPQPTWPRLDVGTLALVVVDLQQLCARPGHGMFATAARLGHPDLLDPYRQRLEQVVVPNVATLTAAARRAGVPVVYTRIRSLTADGRDRSGCHRALGLHVAPEDPDGDILPEIAPGPDDVVVSKTTSDAFVGTNLERLLRNLGRAQLAVCGVLTHECVESTVRHAADLGFAVTVVEDGCAAVEHDRHLASVRNMGQTYARVRSTAAMVAALGGDS